MLLQRLIIRPSVQPDTKSFDGGPKKALRDSQYRALLEQESSEPAHATFESPNEVVNKMMGRSRSQRQNC